ncbi:MAG: Hint domain-containing protein [Acidisphaera sp.]|nr:Hint domain-containing protein [Acidisphaera sp.]
MAVPTTFTSSTITSSTVTASTSTTYLDGTIGTGGLLILKSGAEAIGVTVGAGGELDVNSSATASSVTVTTGGDFSLAPGGIETGVMFSGGTLELGSGNKTSPSGTISGIGSTLAGFDTLDIDKGATWTLSGTAPTTATAVLSNSGMVTLDGSFLFSKAIGSGTATIDTSATLEVANSVGGNQTIAFNPTATLTLDAATNFNGTLDNFEKTDTIDFGGFKAATGTYTVTGDTLLIPNQSGKSTLTFALAGVGSADGTVFTVATGPGSDFTLTDMICYCRGTLIRTERGEIPVEDLAIGDRVVTYDGRLQAIRWIGQRSYAGRFLAGKPKILPVCIRAGALADNVPLRDLHVSPNHAMYIDGALIPAGLLVNGVSVVQSETTEEVHYYHVELAEHDVIWAEGAPSETYLDDDNRAIFHNLDDYAARYPEAAAVPALYCAPRLEDGYVLEAIRRRIAERAGLVQRASELGELTGFLDHAGGMEVRGWAQDLAHPEAPVCLDVLVDGVKLAQTLASLYREDLQHAGMGSGRHSFRVQLDAPLPASGTLEVRRSADAALLVRADLSTLRAAA